MELVVLFCAKSHFQIIRLCAGLLPKFDFLFQYPHRMPNPTVGRTVSTTQHIKKKNLLARQSFICAICCANPGLPSTILCLASSLSLALTRQMPKSERACAKCWGNNGWPGSSATPKSNSGTSDIAGAMLETSTAFASRACCRRAAIRWKPFCRIAFLHHTYFSAANNALHSPETVSSICGCRFKSRC